MAGINIPFIVGTTLGRDHTNWRTRSQAQTNTEIATSTLTALFKNAVRPELTVEQMMAIAWAISDWTFTGTWTASATDTGMITGSSSNTFDISNKAPIQTEFPEEDIESVPNTPTVHDITKEPLHASSVLGQVFSAPSTLLPWLGNYGYNSPLRRTPPTGPVGYLKMNRVSGSFTGSDNLAFLFLLGNARKTPNVFDSGDSCLGIDIVAFESAKFRPLIIFTDGASDFDINFTIDNERSDIPLAPSNAILTIDPVIAPSFEVRLVIKTAGIGSPVLDSFSSDLTLTATKFFECRNTLDEQVYDQNTGAQLHDPFA